LFIIFVGFWNLGAVHFFAAQGDSPLGVRGGAWQKGKDELEFGIRVFTQ